MHSANTDTQERAVVELPPATVELYRSQLSTNGRLDVELPIEIRDKTGALIADASKMIHIRRAKL
jgi:hypothetical protein